MKYLLPKRSVLTLYIEIFGLFNPLHIVWYCSERYQKYQLIFSPFSNLIYQ